MSTPKRRFNLLSLTFIVLYIYIYIYIYIYSDFSSVPRSFHVHQFTYHISLPSFKFHIFINLWSYPPSLYLDAGKEGMIHLSVGSYVQKPEPVVFSDWSRKNTCGLWFAVFWLAVIFQRDFWPEVGQKTESFRGSEFLRGRVFFWSPGEFKL